MADSSLAPAGPFVDIVKRAWADDAFRKSLLSDPEKTLKEGGYELPYAGRLKVLENTESVVYLVLPEKPAEAELSEAELETVSGGQGVPPGAQHRVYPAPYPVPYPYPYPNPYPYNPVAYPYNPAYTPGPTLLNGSWHFDQ